MIDLVAPPPVWVPQRPALIRSARDIKPPAVLASILPGMGGPLAGLSTVFALSFYNSVQSTAATITIPAGAPNGSLAILLDNAHNNSGTPSAVNPNSNWTAIHNASGNLTRTCSWYRILDSDDEGDVITGMDGTAGDDKFMLVFTGTRPITSVTIGDVAAVSSSGNPTAQTCNASGGTAPLIVFGMAGVRSGGGAAFSTESPAFASQINSSDNDITVGYTIYNSGAASDHTVDVNDVSLTNILASFYLQVAAA